MANINADHLSRYSDMGLAPSLPILGGRYALPSRNIDRVLLDIAENLAAHTSHNPVKLPEHIPVRLTRSGVLRYEPRTDEFLDQLNGVKKIIEKVLGQDCLKLCSALPHFNTAHVTGKNERQRQSNADEAIGLMERHMPVGMPPSQVTAYVS